MMNRLRILFFPVILAGAIFLFRPVSAQAVAGSSYVQCLGVVTARCPPSWRRGVPFRP